MTIYLLGIMWTGIPRESFIKAWDGILHRFMHIPTQLLCSRNLQKFKQILEIYQDDVRVMKSLMMILILTMIMMMTIMKAMDKNWVEHTIIEAGYFTAWKCLKLVRWGSILG